MFGDIYTKSFYMLGKIYEQKGWKKEVGNPKGILDFRRET